MQIYVQFMHFIFIYKSYLFFGNNTLRSFFQQVTIKLAIFQCNRTNNTIQISKKRKCVIIKCQTAVISQVFLSKNVKSYIIDEYEVLDL